MKILHLLGDRVLPQDPENGSASGVVRVALELARAQVVLGHQVTIATVGPKGWHTSWCGVELRCLAPATWAQVHMRGRSLDLRTHLPFVNLTLQHRFDVVHGHLYHYLRFLKVARRVAHFHSDPMYRGSKAEGIDLKPADFRCIEQHSDAQVAVSQFVARELARGLAKTSNIHVVYNGVDPARFDPGHWTDAGAQLRNSHGIPDGSFVILFAGAVTPEKGVLELAQAFTMIAAEMPCAHLLLAGASTLWGGSSQSQSYHAEYEHRVYDTLRDLRAAGRVHMLGSISASAMPAVYAAADVVVAPSIWREAFPLVALEAMASARPVIASHIGGLPETTGEDSAILVPPGDVAALAAALRLMATTPELRQSLGAAARRRALRFTWPTAAQQLDRIYRDLPTRSIP